MLSPRCAPLSFHPLSQRPWPLGQAVSNMMRLHARTHARAHSHRLQTSAPARYPISAKCLPQAWVAYDVIAFDAEVKWVSEADNLS